MLRLAQAFAIVVAGIAAVSGLPADPRQAPADPSVAANRRRRRPPSRRWSPPSACPGPHTTSLSARTAASS